MFFQWIVRIMRNIGGVLFAPLWFIARLATRPRRRWVVVRLRSHMVEIDQPVP